MVVVPHLPVYREMMIGMNQTKPLSEADKNGKGLEMENLSVTII